MLKFTVSAEIIVTAPDFQGVGSYGQKCTIALEVERELNTFCQKVVANGQDVFLRFHFKDPNGQRPDWLEPQIGGENE